MVIKGYSVPPKSSEPEPHHQMHFNVIPRALYFLRRRSYTSAGDTVSFFYTLPTGQNDSRNKEG